MAAEFRFRLAPLLRLRERREQAEMRAIARRLAAIADVERQMYRGRSDADRHPRSLRRSISAALMPVDEIMAQRAWLGRLNREWLMLRIQLQAHQEQLAVERARLTEASKQRKVLANLQERRRAEHAFAVNREENRFL